MEEKSIFSGTRTFGICKRKRMGVEEVETRIFVKPERGCGAVYLPCLRRFYALFLIKITFIRPFLLS